METMTLQVVALTSRLPSKHGCCIMRTSAITAAILALSITGTVNASDDFAALLADLSFGDVPTDVSVENEPVEESLTVVQEETLQDLMPMTTGLTMPGMLESSPEASSEKVARVEPAEQPGPQVALMDPIPADVPVKTIDFAAAFALEAPAETPATSVGHPLLGGNCDSGHCGGDMGFDHGRICRPRTPVRLPSSCFHQYWRSHPCYTNVWDGYGIYCGSHHKHLHGECDCFNKSGHGICNGGTNCDTCE